MVLETLVIRAMSTAVKWVFSEYFPQTTIINPSVKLTLILLRSILLLDVIKAIEVCEVLYKKVVFIGDN